MRYQYERYQYDPRPRLDPSEFHEWRDGKFDHVDVDFSVARWESSTGKWWVTLTPVIPAHGEDGEIVEKGYVMAMPNERSTRLPDFTFEQAVTEVEAQLRLGLHKPESLKGELERIY